MEVLSKLKQTIDEECNTAAQFALISFDECDRSDLYIISFLLISFCSVCLLSFCHPSAILLSFCKTKDIFSSLNLIGHHFDGWQSDQMVLGEAICTVPGSNPRNAHYSINLFIGILIYLVLFHSIDMDFFSQKRHCTTE